MNYCYHHTYYCTASTRPGLQPTKVDNTTTTTNTTTTAVLPLPQQWVLPVTQQFLILLLLLLQQSLLLPPQSCFHYCLFHTNQTNCCCHKRDNGRSSGNQSNHIAHRAPYRAAVRVSAINSMASLRSLHLQIRKHQNSLQTPKRAGPPPTPQNATLYGNPKHTSTTSIYLY